MEEARRSRSGPLPETATGVTWPCPRCRRPGQEARPRPRVWAPRLGAPGSGASGAGRSESLRAAFFPAPSATATGLALLISMRLFKGSTLMRPPRGSAAIWETLLRLKLGRRVGQLFHAQVTAAAGRKRVTHIRADEMRQRRPAHFNLAQEQAKLTPACLYRVNSPAE